MAIPKSLVESLKDNNIAVKAILRAKKKLLNVKQTGWIKQAQKQLKMALSLLDRSYDNVFAEIEAREAEEEERE